MKISRMMLGLTLSTSMIACSGAAPSMGSSANQETRRYQDDRTKLENKFVGVVGTYDGSMKIYQRVKDGSDTSQYDVVDIPLQIGIYTEEVSTGKDSQGEAKVLPTLKMRYRQMDTVRSDIILDVRYVEETGEIHASSAVSGNGGAGGNSNTSTSGTTINAVLSGANLTGEVIRAAGKLGTFSLNLSSREVISSSSEADRDFFDRTLNLYKNISGVYTGTVTPPEGSTAKPFPIKIVLSAVQISEDGNLRAALKANYTRPDFIADPTISERFMDVYYRLDTTPAQLIMSSKGGTPQIPDAYFMTITGELDETNHRYEGDLVDRRGFVGHVVLTREKKTAVQ